MMKKQWIILMFLLTASFFGSAYGQAAHRDLFPGSKIRPYALQVGYDKTTILIFPASVSSIDRGSAGIIAKAVPDVENILKVKANKKNFRQTNLTVVTDDGKLYAFTVNYTDHPSGMPVNMGKQKQKEKQIAIFRNRKLNAAQVKGLCRQAAATDPFLHKKDKAFRVKLKLQGIYSCKDVIFYRFLIKNRSNIDYETDFCRFYIRDRKRVKRTARQEKELHPLKIYYADGVRKTAAKTGQVLVIAFPKFTIADHKNFVVQLFEKHGDRNLSLKINGKELAKAQPLSLD